MSTRPAGAARPAPAKHLAPKAAPGGALGSGGALGLPGKAGPGKASPGKPGLSGTLGLAACQIAGGGLIALTAVTNNAALGWALAIATLATVLATVPIAMLASAHPVSGATYHWPAHYLGRTAGFLATWAFGANLVGLSLYAVSVGHYVSAVWSGPGRQMIALAVIVVCTGLALTGPRVAGQAAIVMTLIMVAAWTVLALSTPAGAPGHPLSAAGDTPRLATAATTAAAAALLTLATTGGWQVANLGPSVRQPRRTLPLAILGATILMGAVFTCAVAAVTSTDNLFGQGLVAVAARRLTAGQWTFFLLGAATLTLLAPLVTTLVTATRPLAAAASAGWLPRGLAVTSRSGTPRVLIAGVGVLAAALIVTGFDAMGLALVATVTVPLLAATVAVCSLLMRRREPARYQAGLLHLPYPLHVALVTGSLALAAYQAFTLGRSLTVTAWLTGGGWLALGLVIWALRRRHVPPTAEPPEPPTAPTTEPAEPAKPPAAP